MIGSTTLKQLAVCVRACRLCRDRPLFPPALPHEPRPILQVSAQARILVAGQAPGIRAHTSGLPFDDPSGDRLRDWMGINRAQFYDASRLLIVPMGFCFPGHTPDKGDLPPRRECASLWHEALLALMPQVDLVLAIGRHAQAYHFRRLGRPLPATFKLGDLVRRRLEPFAGGPRVFALPHPSWRNSGWLNDNPWFERDVVPDLREAVAALL
ncbi:MAG: uracil-DNA glycosylase family protein [Beijerinckiaceae bacterium]|nr:uracil-DNA glycosylase family protein [Beijerinckiaceae bacterium]